MRVLFVFSLLGVLSGCTVPAAIQVPSPTPAAVGEPGLSLGGRVGLGAQALVSGNATAVFRPTRALGVFASGLVARTDSSHDRADTADNERLDANYLDARYVEAGVVGAVPLADRIWATGSLAFGQGEVASGGRALGECGLLFCGTRPYVLSAEYERRSARLGLLFENVDGLRTEVGFRLAQAKVFDIERDPDLGLDREDLWVWVAEPSGMMRYDIGVGTLDLEVIVSGLLGDVPEDPNMSEPRPIYDAEASTVTFGATFDLARVFGL